MERAVLTIQLTDTKMMEDRRLHIIPETDTINIKVDGMSEQFMFHFYDGRLVVCCGNKQIMTRNLVR